MNLENSNSNPNLGGTPGAQPGGSTPNPVNPANPAVSTDPANPAAPASGNELDNLINESVFEARHKEATREINRLNESNRLSQEQLRDMADNYKVAKTALQDVNTRLQRMSEAMKASQEAGEVLPASDRLAFEQAEANWLSKKMELENQINGMARKMNSHREAEASLSQDFVARVKDDTLNLAGKFCNLVNGNKATMYQILKDDIIPQIDNNQPHLVDQYRRGEMSLENLVIPHLRQNLEFYKTLYGSRAGGNVDGGGAPAGGGTTQVKDSFSSFAGLL